MPRKDKYLNLRLTTRQHEKLKAIADAKNTTMTKVITEFINRASRRLEK